MARAGTGAPARRRGGSLRLTRARNTLARRFAIPALIALATAAGLAAGLVGDGGGWDAAAWIGLAIPVAASAGALRRAR